MSSRYEAQSIRFLRICFARFSSMAGELIEDTTEHSEKNIKNEAEEEEETHVEGKRIESRRKSSSREAKLAPGDHTLVRRLDGTWRKFAVGVPRPTR